MSCGCTCITFKDIYNQQKDFQKLIINNNDDKNVVDCELPTDSLYWFSYHIQAMVEELGEVMKSDKRWKTHRNTEFNQAEKTKEIADLFITALNIAMYSDIEYDELETAIINKIAENTKKL